MKKKNHYQKPLLRVIKHLQLNPLCYSKDYGDGPASSRQYRSTWDDKE